MFELLLSACLVGAPADCRTERLPGAETLEECRVQARRGAAGFSPLVQVQSFACVKAGETPDYTISEVAPGVFVHQGLHQEPDARNLGDVSNQGFVIGSEAVAVIDTGGSLVVGKALLAAIRAETDLPIRYVILTHMHPDHVMGTAAFADEGAEVIGHARMAPALEDRSETYLEAMGRLIGPAFGGSEVVLPSREVAEELTLNLGGARDLVLQAHATAHTDNDLTVLDRTSGVLFAGDLAFLGHTPALDGSVLGWQKLLEDAIAEPVGDWIVPGHGPVILSWEQGLTPTKAYLDLLIVELRAAIAAGLPMLQAIREVGRGAEMDWLLFEEFHPRNVTAAFKELEWE
ncbi:MAG: quinoprotein relay system zinc metallohydrolase 2 [Pseudomonadota bacterium]